MKKILSVILIAIMLLSAMTFSVSASGEISVYLDAAKIEFDVKPQIINGRTMVPIRAIFESMGADVLWDKDTRSAICTKNDTVVKMTVDSTRMYINNQLTIMDVSPVIIDGRTLAPARYVAEAFGAEVSWDADNSSVLITSKYEYVENTVTLYALDGRTIDVPESEVNDYLNVGWYKTLAETQQTMYAADGRSIKVYKTEVPAYKNVGWYETKYEAEAANKPVETDKPVYSGSASNNTASEYNPSADGNYYRTPTGKKYHLDPNCGGKNSYQTSDISGLTPCSKCAK